MSIQIKDTKKQGHETKWLSVSDLMSGLMMVFMLVSIMLIRDAIVFKQEYESVNTRITEIAEDLRKEFSKDMEKWGADFIEESLEFRFLTPEVNFQKGKSDLKPRFEDILSDFFPRYLEVLKPYRDDIKEVRLEGHTSSEWNADSTDKEAYFENMDLSQRRTRSVLHYVYGLPAVVQDDLQREWVKANIVAVGLSSSKLIRHRNGNENKRLSRRVTFRVITTAEEKFLCIKSEHCTNNE